MNKDEEIEESAKLLDENEMSPGWRIKGKQIKQLPAAWLRSTDPSFASPRFWS
jgi:hypothetical protein